MLPPSDKDDHCLRFRFQHRGTADRAVCQGTLLSWSQYLADLECGEYQDARHAPRGKLTSDDTRHMTDVLQREEQAGQEH